MASPAVTDTMIEKVPKKFPPPCWTQEETICLIEAYRERWYVLRRGYLRTPDWDGVAATVSSKFPDVSPAKTSAQCRHKMEKLRQRYRAEKQRALSYPYPAGRYFSSWFFFDYMEAMENGTTVPTTTMLQNSTDGSRLKSFLDDNILKLKLKEKNEADCNSTVFGFDKAKRSKISYLNVENVAKEEADLNEHEVFVNMSRRKLMNGIQTPTPQLNSKARMFDNFDSNGGFRQQMPPPEYRVMKSDRRTDFHNRGNNSNEEFWLNNVPGSRGNYWESSNSGGKMNGSKRGRNALEDMVASIKLLGEGFVKMERAKMEMAREMEAMRMEMEIKRNEMVLESQKQIVDAFVKGLFEMKANKKVKASADAAESAGT